MKKVAIAILSLVLLAACGGRRMPEGVVGHDRMVPLLVDIYLIEAYYALETNYNYDSLSPEMLRAYDDVLARHGVTAGELEASLAYYSEHPEQYNAIHREVAARLEQENTGAAEATPVKVNVVRSDSVRKAVASR